VIFNRNAGRVRYVLLLLWFFIYSLKFQMYKHKYTCISPISLILTVPSSWLLLASLSFYLKQWNILSVHESNSIERKLRRVNRLLFFFFVMQSASNACTGKGVYIMIHDMTLSPVHATNTTNPIEIIRIHIFFIPKNIFLLVIISKGSMLHTSAAPVMNASH